MYSISIHSTVCTHGGLPPDGDESNLINMEAHATHNAKKDWHNVGHMHIIKACDGLADMAAV